MKRVNLRSYFLPRSGLRNKQMRLTERVFDSHKSFVTEEKQNNVGFCYQEVESRDSCSPVVVFYCLLDV